MVECQYCNQDFAVEGYKLSHEQHCPHKDDPNLKYWWEFLDWSHMKVTFEMVSEDLKKKILDKGSWSLGKGKFDGNNTSSSPR